MEIMYTTKDLCEMFHVSDQTLRNWTKEGKLNPIRIGKKICYLPEDIRTLCSTYSRSRIAQTPEKNNTEFRNMEYRKTNK